MEEIEAAYKRWDQERRENARVPLKLEVRWEGSTGKHLAETVDVGSGGCFIASAQMVPIGNRLIFEMQMPTGRSIRLFGEVIYHLTDSGFGIRFKFLNEMDRDAITLLVDYARATGQVE